MGRTVLATDPQPVRLADLLDTSVSVNHDELAAALEICPSHPTGGEATAREMSLNSSITAAGFEAEAFGL